eukprot:TRINITY_DN4921_c0_g2_i1.p2 TRINITY_DN4921_c0_g2~~TRINITY_DN4921_c0_g2_i1.p2  ORF type:complete len:172 (+),score=66.57 TRINITY_DN4921_c0_g2_i1:37-552(+)
MQEDLESCLFDPSKASEKRLFREYLQKRFATENLNFIEAVVGYRKADAAKRIEVAAEIRDTFLLPDSPQEINLDEGLNKDAIKALDDPEVHNDGKLFDKAFDSILFLLASDCYPTFRASPAFKAFFNSEREARISASKDVAHSVDSPKPHEPFHVFFTVVALASLFLVSLQ